MSDYGEIASLVSRVAWMVDHDDYDDFMDYWMADGTLRHVSVDGHVTERQGQGIVELLKIAYLSPESKTLHIATAPVIDINGNTARVRYCILNTKWVRRPACWEWKNATPRFIRVRTAGGASHHCTKSSAWPMIEPTDRRQLPVSGIACSDNSPGLRLVTAVENRKRQALQNRSEIPAFSAA